MSNAERRAAVEEVFQRRNKQFPSQVWEFTVESHAVRELGNDAAHSGTRQQIEAAVKAYGDGEHASLFVATMQFVYAHD